MIIEKMYRAQRNLDQRIVDKHPELKEIPDVLDKKTIALIVELGEAANEWRGFKFWSTDQKQRREKMVVELVDCLHFILSIGIEIDSEFIPLPENVTSRFDMYKTKGYTTERILCELVVAIADTTRKTLNERTYQLGTIFEMFLALCMNLDVTIQDLNEVYFEKNKINLERQENGY